MKHSQTGIAKKFLFLMVGLLMAIGVNAQSITVSGTVTDPQGEPLIGASVLAEGTTNGASTDIDGNYTIKVASNAILVVSYVGYDTQRVPVEGRTTVNVEMKENSVMLNEVVAIGYGTVRKQDATGSVAIVKPDEIEAGLATSVQDMLVGQTPGVVVTTSGGPSGAADIRIRGGASLSASNDPLIVLDGVPLSADTPLGMGSPLAMINPESIESMTILKDASATAIYGSRASNGVIIITTKKGRSGKPQVTFTANLYIDYARRTADVMNAGQFRELVYNKFGQNSAAAGYLGDTNTDWQDQIFRTAVSSDYSLAVAGTAGVLPYRVDVSYTNNNGILEASSMDRVTVGLALTPKFFNDHLSINAKVKGFYVRNDWGQSGAIGQAVSYNPTLPVRNYQPITGGTSGFGYLFNGYTEPWTLSGGLVNLENNATYNPVATIDQTKNYSNVYRSNGNIQFDYSFHFLPELHANLNLGYDVTKSNDYYIVEANSHMAWKDLPNNYGGGSSRQQYAFRSNTLLEFYLNYKKEFEAIKSMLDATAGYTWSRDAANGWNDGSNSIQGKATTQGLSSAIANADGTYTLNWNPATADQVGKPFQADDIDANGNYHWKNHLQLLSFFGRVNYTFKERYLLTATVRGDATSRFSKDNRWGVFPAVALGWRINDEAFMADAAGWLSDLKLRAGWGETGQQAVGNYYNYIPTYTVSSPGSYYTNGMGGWLTPYFPDGYNPDLKWETTETWNAGIDFGFFNNRITGAIEYYKRNTRDLLSTVPVAAGSSTVAYLPQNIGKMENYGIEFAINAKPIVTDNFTWTLSYNVGWNHNEITDLNGLTFEVGGGGGGTGGNVQIQKEGYPAYSFNLFQQVYGADGNPIPGAYVDQNGDGVIDPKDKVVRYSKDPKVTMTFGSNFRYKQWDFGFTLRASIGNYMYADALRSGTDMSGMFRNNQLSNLWVADYYYDTTDTNFSYSDYWLRNASFLRCDNINLGYTFENLLNDNLKLRIFAAVQNPFVITKYKGLDPEVFSGVDGNIYPRATTWSLGVVANF